MSRIAVLLFALLLLRASACTCAKTTFAEDYENAKTVVKARVVTVTVSPTPTPPPCRTASPPCLLPDILPQSVKYKLRRLRIFKGCDPGDIFFGKSFEDSALCGVRLKKGKVYLLNLQMLTPDLGGQPDSFSITRCQKNRLFERLTEKQKRFLRRKSRKLENQCIMHA